MVWQPLKDALIRTLEVELRPLGFTYRQARTAFERRDDDYCHRFHLVFVDRRESGADVWCWWGIRHSLVEAIFHETSGFRKQYHLGTSTVGCEHRPPTGGEPYYHRLGTTTDITPIAARLLRIFNELASPFFREYSSLPAMDRLLNSAPDEPCRYQGIEPLRCHHGLVLAHLTRSEQYVFLAEAYRRRLQEFMDGAYLPQFELLVANLRTRRPGAV